jgi:pyruvate/2-oxoglutarate dehydrogenase complex dihydrolipoamide dehydrogenase (E3) component
LCEKGVPFKQRLHEYIEQQKYFISKSKIDVRMNTEVTQEYAAAEKPDVIIAAVGSEPVVPDIPGIDLPNVHQAMDVYRDPSLARGKVVILGAGFVGAELAIYLHDFGVKAEIIEMLGDISDGGNDHHKDAVKDMIIQKNIPVHYNTRAVEITSSGVRCNGPDGDVLYNADTIICAVGMKALQVEALTFEKIAPFFHMVGECRRPANILFATSTGYTAAKSIGRFSKYI